MGNDKMGSDLPRYSFMDLQKKFHSSLADQGLEIVVPPGQPIPQGRPENILEYTSKPLPLIPTELQRNTSRMNQVSQNYGPRLPAESSTASTVSPVESISPEFRSKSSSPPSRHQYLHNLPPPPKPPMSNSNRKILQLTGHDPSHDRTLTQHSEFLESSSSASSSSGSVYSHPETEAKGMELPSRDKRSSAQSEPTPAIIGTTQLKSSTLNTMGQGIKAYYPPAAGGKQPHESEDPRKNFSRTFSTEPMTIRDFLHDTKSRSASEASDDRNRMQDPNLQHLVPEPLAIRTKSKQRENSGGKSSIFANARDSMSWGIDALTSPTKNKHPSIPEEDGIISEPQKIIHRTPGKSLKSPLNLNRSSPQNEKSDGKLSKRFSGVMKRLSGGKSPPRPTVISNVARKPGGPDTPAPKSSIMMISPSEALQHGNEHFQEAYAKAKKSLRIKTAEEKRRESLKKKIVVVGVSDQSPNGRVTEWL